MCVYVFVHKYVHMCVGACRGQVSESLELELLMDHLVAGDQTQVFWKSRICLWAISLSLLYFNYTFTISL